MAKNRYLSFTQEMGALFSKAAHIPYFSGVAGTAEAEGVIAGRAVRIVGSMVDRNTLDGHVPVLMLRSFVDGKQVNRQKLLELCGVEIVAKRVFGQLPKQ